MDKQKNNPEGTTSAEDNVDHSARYSDDGEITRQDERDRHDSTDEWNAEDSRTGRNK